MSTFPTYFPVIKSFELLKEKPIKFILRKKYLDQIKDLFETNQILIIHGFGGVGKTTLALEYCNLLATSNDHDPNIRWLNSNSDEILETEYKKLARLFDINVIGEDLDFVIERTNIKLKQINKEILFVFDNVESYDDIERYINKKLPKNIKILITTRNQLKNVDFPKIDLEPFDIDEAKEYLNKNLSKKANEDILLDKILDLAKSTNEYILPIKLEIIVSYMNFYYIQDVDKSISEIEDRGYHYQKGEYALFFKLIENDDEAFDLLQNCSLLNPDFISYRLLLAIKDNENEKSLQQKIEKLTKLSLILLIDKNEDEGIKIHRLVQEELINYCKLNENDTTLIRIESLIEKTIDKVNKLFIKVSNDPKELRNNEEYYLNSLNIYEKHYENFINEKNKNIFVALLNKIINYELQAEKNHRNINKKSLKLLEICEKYYHEDDSNLAEAFNNIGESYDRLNNDKKALEYQLKALEMRQRLYDNDHPDIASSLNSVGYSYGELNDYNKALEYILKALDMYQRLYNFDHPDIASSLNNVGCSFGKLNDNNKALEYEIKALEMRQRLYDYDHPDIASSLSNVGWSYGKLNNNNKDLEYKLKALEMYQRLFDFDHPDIAKSLNNVGMSFGNLNDNKKALEYHLKALDMYQRLFDYAHPDIAMSLINVGASYGKLNDKNKALEYNLKALEMRQRLYDYDHPDIASSLNKVGYSYSELNDNNKALEFLLKALDMYQRLYDLGRC